MTERKILSKEETIKMIRETEKELFGIEPKEYQEARENIAECLCDDIDLAMRYGYWESLDDWQKDEYYDEADQILSISGDNWGLAILCYDKDPDTGAVDAEVIWQAGEKNEREDKAVREVLP